MVGGGVSDVSVAGHIDWLEIERLDGHQRRSIRRSDVRDTGREAGDGVLEEIAGESRIAEPIVAAGIRALEHGSPHRARTRG